MNRALRVSTKLKFKLVDFFVFLVYLSDIFLDSLLDGDF